MNTTGILLGIAVVDFFTCPRRALPLEWCATLQRITTQNGEKVLLIKTIVPVFLGKTVEYTDNGRWLEDMGSARRGHSF